MHWPPSPGWQLTPNVQFKRFNQRPNLTVWHRIRISVAASSNLIFISRVPGLSSAHKTWVSPVSPNEMFEHLEHLEHLAIKVLFPKHLELLKQDAHLRTLFGSTFLGKRHFARRFIAAHCSEETCRVDEPGMIDHVAHHYKISLRITFGISDGVP